MSAIGNYVHYYTTNYLQYGTKKRSALQNKVSIDTWNKIKDDISNQVKKTTYNADTVQEIENTYNHWRDLITEINDKGAMEKVRNKIAQLLIQKMQAVDEETEIRWARGDLYNPPSEASVANAIGKLKKDTRELATPKKGRVSVKYVLEQTTAQFKKAYEELKTIKDVTKREVAKQRLDAVEQAFYELVETENQELKRLKLTGIHTSKTVLSLASYNNTINAIRTILGLRDTSSLANAKGALEEYIGAAINLAAKGKAADAIVGELENEIKKGGSKHTKGTVTSNMSALSQAAAQALKDSSLTYLGDDGKYHYKIEYHSQQKMDVLFEWEPSSQKSAALSIKNYNLGSGHPISLVKESPLSIFLFNMGNVDYTNHFLNIFAHLLPNATYRKYRSIAEDSLAYYLLWSAMSGKGVGKTEGTADIFVVKDSRKKEGVKIWDIGALVDKIIQRGNLQQDLIIDESLSKLKLNNTWVRGNNIGANVQQRISKLLINCHAHKLTVHISPQVLLADKAQS